MEQLPSGESSNPLVPSTRTAIEAYETSPLAAEPSEGGGHAQITRLLAALVRYKWLIAVISVLGIAGSVVATRFIKPTYRTGATVYIEGAGRRRVSSTAGPIAPGELLQEDSWVQLLRSFAVLDPVIRKNHLFITNEPEDSLVFQNFDVEQKFRSGKFRLKVDESGRHFTVTNEQGTPFASGTVGDSIGRQSGWHWAPPPSVLGKNRTIKFALRTPRAASEDINLAMKTVLPQNATFMAVMLDGRDPDQIAATLNGILEQFVRVAADLKQSRLKQLTADLEGQLNAADSTAKATESGLESYRIETITEPREDAQQFPLPSGLVATTPSVMQNYYAKKLQLSAIQKDRKAIEDVLERGKAQGVVVVDAFHTIAIVKQAPDLVNALADVSKAETELRVARQRYTEEHRVVQDLKDRLKELQAKTVPMYALRLVDQLKTQEADLEKEITVETAEIKKIPVRTQTEEKLRREATSAVALSQNLQNRLQENKLAIMSETPDVTILDRAVVPTDPASNTALRIVLMGVVGSIGFALLLAILLDRLDNRFRYPDQASNELGLTILGAVPVIRKGRGVVRSPTETSQIIEAFRSIRLNLVHSFSAESAITVTITSPAPGDGKSLISANLAMSFADAGYHTLLIDGDIRRGELYRVFHVDRMPGLLDYLDGETSAETLVRPTAHDRLAVIPAGSRRVRGPELLGSARMVELMRRLANEYQVVIVDSPPLGAGVDPFVLGTVTGNTLVVLRAGETDRRLAQAKVQLLDRLPTRLVGAVLNHINLDEGAYKYYAYEYPYHAEVEPEQLAPPTDEPATTTVEER